MTSTFTAEVTKVNDCAGGPKSSGSTKVEFDGGEATATVSVPGPQPPIGSGVKVCFTLTAGGKSQSIQAAGGLVVQEEIGTESGGGQNGGGGESGGSPAGSTAGGDAGTSAGNASAGSGSTP
ncbi:hypothetical protein [Kitasatospora sp. NPDC058218]|uniref:hypothetical protein n=1 Tax=Kitasatospora sp. NPDC058218 TaxID=3346385 RepID=UPI0036DE1E1C